jgi:hypothetical protein
MGHLSNLRIDFWDKLALGLGMRYIPAFPLLALPLLALTACATFPKVDAVASKTIGPRPALLTLEQVNALPAQSPIIDDNSAAPLDDLRALASGLRSR